MLAALRRILPDAPVIYAADLAGLPYGKKTEAEVAARVCGLLGRMAERYHPRLICIACNTASTIALGMVRDVLEIPIVGTVPAIKPAAAMTRSGVIGLLGTEATIRQSYVDNLEREFASDKLLLRHAAPGLVDPAEAKLRGNPVDATQIERAVAGLLERPRANEIDTVVLACTHFPLLRDELQSVLGRDVALVDGAEGIARRIVALTEGQPFARSEPDSAITTGAFGQFERLARELAKLGIDEIREF
ncbi:Glutamate racemase [Erythrobacter sp. THAF29]|nr:Glutamate racemase [Erythrobacter sp. THAF29]